MGGVNPAEVVHVSAMAKQEANELIVGHSQGHLKTVHWVLVWKGTGFQEQLGRVNIPIRDRKIQSRFPLIVIAFADSLMQHEISIKPRFEQELEALRMPSCCCRVNGTDATLFDGSRICHRDQDL